MINDLPDLIGCFGNKIPVVAYQDHTAFIFIQCFDQQITAMHIQVIGRFIQHQEIGFAHNGFCQCNPCFFTTT